MNAYLNQGFLVHRLEPNKTEFVEDQAAYALLSGNKGETCCTFLS